MGTEKKIGIRKTGTRKTIMMMRRRRKTGQPLKRTASPPVNSAEKPRTRRPAPGPAPNAENTSVPSRRNMASRLVPSRSHVPLAKPNMKPNTKREEAVPVRKEAPARDPKRVEKARSPEKEKRVVKSPEKERRVVKDPEKARKAANPERVKKAKRAVKNPEKAKRVVKSPEKAKRAENPEEKAKRKPRKPRKRAVK